MGSILSFESFPTFLRKQCYGADFGGMTKQFNSLSVKVVRKYLGKILALCPTKYKEVSKK